jgi:hypothetical protein
MSNELSHLSYLALEEMRKGLYLLRQKGAEGLCVGGSLVSIKKLVKAGTIKELLEHKLIRQSINSRNLYLLTENGRAYKKQ